MTAAGGSALEGLLRRHLPLLRYDSQEPYFADSASEWTDNPGNVLIRKDGTPIAAATPDAGEQHLNLGFLGPKTYSDQTAVSRDDRIRDPSHSYTDQVRPLHAQPAYANRTYGHWATGSDERVWLSYWFFYFYNDYNLVGALVPAGLHEGDWEMIQLRLDAAGTVPDLAVYAQHAAAEVRPWEKVQRVGSQPVVYPARGSHASYFDTGFLDTGVHQTPAKWFDYANGKRRAPQLTLELVSDDDPAYQWIAWPGMWGGTVPQGSIVGFLEDSSPRGPGLHAQWHDPHVLLEKAKDGATFEVAPAGLETLPPSPTVALERDGASLRVTYSSPLEVAQLMVTINSPQEPLPPAAYTVSLKAPHGTVEIPAGLHDDWNYDIHVSVAEPDGQSSPSIELPLPAAR